LHVTLGLSFISIFFPDGNVELIILHSRIYRDSPELLDSSSLELLGELALEGCPPFELLVVPPELLLSSPPLAELPPSEEELARTMDELDFSTIGNKISSSPTSLPTASSMGRLMSSPKISSGMPSPQATIKATAVSAAKAQDRNKRYERNLFAIQTPCIGFSQTPNNPQFKYRNIFLVRS